MTRASKSRLERRTKRVAERMAELVAQNGMKPGGYLLMGIVTARELAVEHGNAELVAAIDAAPPGCAVELDAGAFRIVRLPEPEGA